MLQWNHGKDHQKEREMTTWTQMHEQATDPNRPVDLDRIADLRTLVNSINELSRFTGDAGRFQAKA
jgi:hypothetical protein